MAYEKRAAEVKDYQIDWSKKLLVNGVDTGDAVSTSSWVVESGITKDSDTKATKTTTVWLSGGTAGVEYTLTNRVVTTGGRTYEQSFVVTITSPPA